MARGFVYLTAVVDVASRRVLPHRVAITLEAIHAKEVIEQALAQYGTPEIVDTDQGSQFTAEEFTSVVLGAGAKRSMDGRGAWRDNVFVERLWRSVKYERIYLKAYDSVSAARADIAQSLQRYNTQRAHSTLERTLDHCVDCPRASAHGTGDQRPIHAAHSRDAFLISVRHVLGGALVQETQAMRRLAWNARRAGLDDAFLGDWNTDGHFPRPENAGQARGEFGHGWPFNSA